jgi:hypothetical protein
MKYFLLGITLLVGVFGQKHRVKAGKGPEDEETINGTSPEKVTPREWMEVVINQFFDDFEAGVTTRAAQLFARGCPYISNGAVYLGMDMSEPATWAVIPRKTRRNREFTNFNKTETWVRSIGTYEDGHQAVEFTAFTFDDEGKINSMSKIEGKECPTVVAEPAKATQSAPTPQSSATTQTSTQGAGKAPQPKPKPSTISFDTATSSAPPTPASTASVATTTQTSAATTAAQTSAATTAQTSAAQTAAAPTAAQTSAAPAPTGKGKAKGAKGSR